MGGGWGFGGVVGGRGGCLGGVGRGWPIRGEPGWLGVEVRMDARRLVVVVVGLVLGAWALAGGACATLTSGVTQPIEVRTDPSGATVVADGVVRGTTPCIVRLYRGRDATLEIRKPGFVSETVFITTRMDGDVMAKVFGGAIVGGAFDLATGAAMKLAPDSITLALRPGGTGGGEGDGAMGVAGGVGGAGGVGASVVSGAGMVSAAEIVHPLPLEMTGDRGVATGNAPGAGGVGGVGGVGGAAGAGGMSAELEARLAAIDELLARGILTPAEHAKARERAIAEAVGGAGGAGGTSVGGVTTP